MDLDDLRIFLAVYQAGHFSPVARARKVAPSSISRAIARLESALGQRLFQRSTRTLTPTQDAESFYLAAAPLLEELDGVIQRATSSSHKPQGRLRVSASVAFGQIQLQPKLQEFCDRYPDVQLDLIADDERSDLVQEQIDVAFRHGLLDDSAYIARKLCSVSYHLVASPAYLEHAGHPSALEDLNKHRLLTFGFAPFHRDWRFDCNGENVSVPIQPSLLASNALLLLAAAKSGQGIALLADWTVGSAMQSGELHPVLPDYRPLAATDRPAIWVMYPSRAYVPAKTRVFIDYITEAYS
ncbi:MAG: LysR family transcriptional regulator [Pseudomonadota bacterium]